MVSWPACAPCGTETAASPGANPMYVRPNNITPMTTRATIRAQVNARGLWGGGTWLVDCHGLAVALGRVVFLDHRSSFRRPSLCHMANLRCDREIGIVGRLCCGSYHPTISTPT